ncbi:uncharacterized protein LOC131019143 [Salvia miltiorrhiza]|uniref:uncharacterized protein LOC131019143 n=1 Tax=Salvia miltiorrhiza TaxID=226208 RepID=UPI0025AD03E5|nr:uncharacterized protein LOC131019143 [Salvia miltiorrhiza]
MGKIRHTKWNVLVDEEAGTMNEEDMEDSSANEDLRRRSGDDRRNHRSDSSALDSKQIEEILQLHNADHPGMQLVSAQLTGNNFLNWSRSVKRALGAKSKLELLDGTLPEPDFASPYYKAWIKADYMISSWIINSISKDLVNAFVHIDNTQKLWDALNQRFGRSNGPKIYRLQREIGKYTQGNQSVLVYFNNLTALWDEYLDMLLPPLTCVCGTRAAGVSREENQRLMQFLLGLNDSFESARSQILFLDPLPSVNRAYSMVLQIEDQKMTTENFGETHAMQAIALAKQMTFKGKDSASYGKQQQNFKMRKTKEERQKLYCSHCDRHGHEEAECFKIHGFPDWYKKLKEGRAKAKVNYAEAVFDGESGKSSNLYNI